MVEVEMRREDVAHVGRIEAERADPRDRGLRRIQLWADGVGERHPELAWVARVGEAEAGVDEDELVGALDQQAVADQSRARQQATFACDHARAAGTHGAAIEVMDRAWGGIHVVASVRSIGGGGLAGGSGGASRGRASRAVTSGRWRASSLRCLYVAAAAVELCASRWTLRWNRRTTATALAASGAAGRLPRRTLARSLGPFGSCAARRACAPGGRRAAGRSGSAANVAPRCSAATATVENE